MNGDPRLPPCFPAETLDTPHVTWDTARSRHMPLRSSPDPPSIVDFETKNGGDENAAARTAGHRRAGAAAARRRGRTGSHRARGDDHGPARPRPAPLGRGTGPDGPRLAPGRRRLGAFRTTPRAGRSGRAGGR